VFVFFKKYANNLSLPPVGGSWEAIESLVSFSPSLLCYFCALIVMHNTIVWYVSAILMPDANSAWCKSRHPGGSSVYV